MISVHHQNNSPPQRVLRLTEGLGAGRLIPPAGTRAATESRQFFEPQPRAQRVLARARTRRRVRLSPMSRAFHNTIRSWQC